jgi:hypothetical protein
MVRVTDRVANGIEIYIEEKRRPLYTRRSIRRGESCAPDQCAERGVYYRECYEAMSCCRYR